MAAAAEKAGVSKKVAEAVLNGITSTIIDTVAKGDAVQLIGFGTFTTSSRAAREGRNPATGETMKIAASKSPKFKVGKAFKDSVNK